MSLVEWCEANVARYEYTPSISEFTNSFSNLAFIVVSFYSSGQNPHCDYAIRMVGLGSFAFHATESYWGQLADELPMSLLAYFYYQLVSTFEKSTFEKSTFGKSGAKSQSTIDTNSTFQKGGAKSQSTIDTNSQSVLLHFFEKWILAVVWFIYIKYKMYSLFVSFFALQLAVPLYLVTVVMPKTDQQKFELSKGAFFALLAVGCWAYERHLHSIGHCPTNPNDARYYLHSYWHIGMAAAHMQFMRCIEHTREHK